MHAADVVEAIPAATLDDALLPAVRRVVARGLPGLIVADDQGRVLRCLSSVDLVRLTLPSYMRGEPNLARVVDEAHADRIATVLAETRIRDVLDQQSDDVPAARPEATMVELAEIMVRNSDPFVVVKDDRGVVGIVTANRLLDSLLTAVTDNGP